MELLALPLGCGIISLVSLGFIARRVISKDSGNKKMKEIASHIEEGAMAFIKREYKYL